jgi:hypothetical protein
VLITAPFPPRHQAQRDRARNTVDGTVSLGAVILDPSAEAARTDAELATEDVDGQLLIAIEIAAWSRLRLAGLELAALVAAEGGGISAARPLISALAKDHLARSTVYWQMHD